MKNLALVVSLLLVAGCSFKKDGVETVKGNPPQLSASEIVRKSVEPPFDKLAYAIDKNDSDLFYDVLKEAKRTDLNRLSPYGTSLLEMALLKKRYEFFKALIAAGTSPFMPTFDAPQGLGTTFVSDNEAKEALINAIQDGRRQATRVCLMNNLKKTIDYLAESFLTPEGRVCDQYSLFEYSLSEELSGAILDNESKILLVKTYVKKSQLKYQNYVAALLHSAIKVRDEKILSLVGYECAELKCTGIPFDFDLFRKPPLNEVLEHYRFFSTNFYRGVIVQAAPTWQPPAPVFYGIYGEQEKLDIVTIVQNIVRDRIAKSEANEREELAQQLQDLHLN